MKTKDKLDSSVERIGRRRLIALLGAGGLATTALPAKWGRPLVSSVVLPAHAVTSVCVTNATTGGPLLGNPTGATTCQAACQVEADNQGALLCGVTETMDVAGAVQCGCDLQLP